MTTDSVGGVWTFSIDLAGELSSEGVEIALVVLGGPPSEEQQVRALRIPKLVLFPSSFKLEWMDNPWADIDASGEWLLQLEREFAPDIIHLNSFGHGALHWDAPVVLTAHSCVVSWWKAVNGEPVPASWARYVEHVRNSLVAVERIVAPSAAMLATLYDNYDLRRDNPPSLVIPNGSKLRGIPAKKQPIILAAGRLWDEGKNMDALARIAPGLPWPVYVAGDTGGKDVAKQCTWLGKLSQEDLAHYFAMAAIFAHPARYEPFGLSVLEAALSRCALVLGDIPSLREIWEGAAIFVPPNDAQALSSSIRELIANDALRERIASLAFGRAQEFTTRRVASAYADLYRGVLQRSFACAS